jgi:hypothetical protein
MMRGVCFVRRGLFLLVAMPSTLVGTSYLGLRYTQIRSGAWLGSE